MKVKFELEESSVSLILKGLAKLPIEDAVKVYNDVVSQLQAHNLSVQNLLVENHKLKEEIKKLKEKE